MVESPQQDCLCHESCHRCLIEKILLDDPHCSRLPGSFILADSNFAERSLPNQLADVVVVQEPVFLVDGEISHVQILHHFREALLLVVFRRVDWLNFFL